VGQVQRGGHLGIDIIDPLVNKSCVLGVGTQEARVGRLGGN
jgi:hypothetical protein